MALLRARLRAPRHAAERFRRNLAEIDALPSAAPRNTASWSGRRLRSIFPMPSLRSSNSPGFRRTSITPRASSGSLGGAEGAITAGAVCTWISGYPLRVSYATAAPDYDPYRWAIGRMLKDGEGDLLVWIASISPSLVPPPTGLPTIVLGTPGLALAAPPAVFIPVGTPGLDHSARLIRVDNVVSLPLKGRAPLPSSAEILAAIQAALRAGVKTMLIKLVGGRVYDPANKVSGEIATSMSRTARSSRPSPTRGPTRPTT